MSASDENDNYLNEETSLLPANYTAQKQENNGSGHIDDDGAGQHLKISTTIILLLVASILGMPLLLATTTSNKAKVSNDLVDNSVVDTSASESAVSPHIVFILADDLGWNALGYNNYDLSFATPNIDSLAQGGLTLANYYAQEICTPSRASLLTGRYPLTVGMQTGVVAGYTPWGLNLNEETIAEVLSDAGYATHIIGKWHLGHHSPRYLPTARGFDTFVGYLDGDNYYYSKRNPFSDTFRDFLVADRDCYAPYVAGNLHNYSTHLYKDLAVEIIESHDQTTPLFLYLPFQAVHTPFVVRRVYAPSLCT
jgi:arylsulfatase A-like enzyme